MEILQKHVDYPPSNQQDSIIIADGSSWGSIHYTSGFSIKYIQEGKVRYKVNHISHIVSAGEFLLVQKGSVIETASLSEVKAISLFLSADTFKNMIHQSQIQEQEIVQLFNNSYTGNDFSNLTPYLASLSFTGLPNTDKLKILENATQLLFSDLSNRIALFDTIKRKKYTTKNEIMRQVSKVKSYVDRSTTEPFDLTRLAEKSCMSKYHLIRYFKQAYNITPQKYFFNKRMESAKLLLKENNYSVSEISHRCGFPDVQTFSKQFKKIIGISPSSFRGQSSFK